MEASSWDDALWKARWPVLRLTGQLRAGDGAGYAVVVKEISVKTTESVSATTVLESSGVLVQAQMPPPSFLAASLDVVPVAEVVGLLVRQRLTGRLDVATPTGTRSLFFEGGTYTGGTSTLNADRFGEVLWRNGHLSLDQLATASAYAEQQHVKLFGRAVVELGFLDATKLRTCLVEQALAIFEAACLENSGTIAFEAHSTHRQPLRFGLSTTELVERALRQAEEHRAVLARIGRLDRTFTVAAAGGLLPRRPGDEDAGFMMAPRTSALDEGEQAIVQLLSSAKEPKTGLELIAASGLGQQLGARTIMRLLENGRLVAKAPAASQETQLRRLCQAVTVVMEALDEAGFGVADNVRELVENPPAHLEEALSGLTLRDPLDGDAVLENAQFLPGGVFEMNDALQAVLDEALAQAADTLAGDVMQAISRRVDDALHASAPSR